MYNFLKVVEISDVQVGKSGNKFLKVWFRPVAMLPNGTEIFNNQQAKMRNLFAAHDDFKADPLYDDIVSGKIAKGTLVEGKIVRFDTKEYQPEDFDRTISSYTCVVFANEDGVAYANRQLKNNFTCVVDGLTGELTAPNQCDRPSKAPAKEIIIEDLA